MAVIRKQVEKERIEAPKLTLKDERASMPRR
jgi:hypothetical protein